jgi:tRNA(Ile)-lysidine synthase
LKPGGVIHTIGRAIQDHQLWEPGARVAVAVSGGVDSVVLLRALHETRAWHHAGLSVVSVDHGVRPDSASDLDFVADLARELQLPFTGVRVSVPPDADEATLRDARYSVFASLDVDRVALGHHAGDQAETALLNLIRGTARPDLGAMRWRRDRFVRPMLGLARADLAAFAEQRGLAWRDDPSNADPRFLRNRIRAELIPLIEALRPGAPATIARNVTKMSARTQDTDGD